MSKISIVIESKIGYKTLPLILIDIDNYFSKLNLRYEVLISSKDGNVSEVVGKFSKLILDREFKIFERKISVEDVDSDAVIILTSDFVPEFESFKNLILSIRGLENEVGYELAFGAHGSISKWSIYNQIGLLLGSPIDIRFGRSIFAFTRSIAGSIFSLQSWSDLEIATLGDKLGFSIGEISMRFRPGEKVPQKKSGEILWQLIKIKLLGFGHSAKHQIARG